MFSPFDYFLWAVILGLESAAAVLTFRRQKWLSILLFYRSAADLLGMILLGTAGMGAFQWEDYLQRMIQLPILGILAVYCAGAAAGDSRGVRIYSGPFAAGVAIWLAAVHGLMPWNLYTVLWIAQKTVFGIAGMVGLALFLRQFDFIRGKLEKPWGATSAGLLMLLGTAGLAMMAREHHWLTWANASRWGQLGAISAQLIWVAGPLRKVKLPEFRQSLEKRFPKVEEMRVM